VWTLACNDNFWYVIDLVIVLQINYTYIYLVYIIYWWNIHTMYVVNKDIKLTVIFWNRYIPKAKMHQSIITTPHPSTGKSGDSRFISFGCPRTKIAKDNPNGRLGTSCGNFTIWLPLQGGAFNKRRIKKSKSPLFHRAVVTIDKCKKVVDFHLLDLACRELSTWYNWYSSLLVKMTLSQPMDCGFKPYWYHDGVLLIWQQYRLVHEWTRSMNSGAVQISVKLPS
jgi:hypothetical protein